MKVFEINSTCNGSTGKIAYSLCRELRKDGHNAFFAYGIGFLEDPDSLKLSNWFESRVHDQLSKITGKQGYYSYFRTLQLIRKIKEYDPDIIHLHNLHGNYLHLPSLFRFLVKSRSKIIVTMHDCWWITGKCAHFTFVQCDRWKTGCGQCPQWGVYPKSYFIDRSRKCYQDKKRWLLSVKDRLLVVTPSKWLANIVRQSFLQDCRIEVVNNGIDLSIFNPSQKKDLSAIPQTQRQFIVLGVAFRWGQRKGLDIFNLLAEQLPSNFSIILIGTDSATDNALNKRIISIHSTNNQKELAGYYAAADVFVNPTREDNFPTTNIEALACGTPVITFNVGGSPEILDSNCGCVVPCEDINSLKNEIINCCTTHRFKKEDCVARGQLFSQKAFSSHYMELFKDLFAEKTTL